VVLEYIRHPPYSAGVRQKKKNHIQSMGLLEEAYGIYVHTHREFSMLGGNSLNRKDVCGEWDSFNI